MRGITVEDQIKAIHQSQGLVEDDSIKIGPSVVPKHQTYGYQLATLRPVDSTSILLRPPVQPMVMMHSSSATIMRPSQTPMVIQQPQQNYLPPQPVPTELPPPQTSLDFLDEPAYKRAKTEDQLIPEEEFIATCGGPNALVSFNLHVPHIPDKSEWNLNGQAITFNLKISDQVSVIKTKLSEILGMPIAKQKLQYEVRSQHYRIFNRNFKINFKFKGYVHQRHKLIRLL